MPERDDAYTKRLVQLAEGSWDDPRALLARMLLYAERDEMPPGGLRADAEAFLGVADISQIQYAPAPVGETRDGSCNLRDARAAMCSEGGRLYVEREVLTPFGYRMVSLGESAEPADGDERRVVNACPNCAGRGWEPDKPWKGAHRYWFVCSSCGNAAGLPEPERRPVLYDWPLAARLSSTTKGDGDAVAS